MSLKEYAIILAVAALAGGLFVLWQGGTFWHGAAVGGIGCVIGLAAHKILNLFTPLFVKTPK
jgi:hypothetical protein